MNQQKDKPHYELVVKSFAKLGINSKTPSRQEKIQFIDHMNQVLMDIKGFLCVLWWLSGAVGWWYELSRGSSAEIFDRTSITFRIMQSFNLQELRWTGDYKLLGYFVLLGYRICANGRVELCFEGHRYKDLKRLGVDANRGIERDLTDCTIQSGACSLPADDFRFTLPIPIVEINGNPGIASQQNPGY